MGIDDFLEFIKNAELDGAEFLTPVSYARLRGIYAQRVYKAIKNGKLQVHTCQCNRKVIKVSEADRMFKNGQSSTAE